MCVCVCVWGGVLLGRGVENDAPPTKTCNDVVNDVLKMLTDRNYTMFLNIENDYYR